MAEVARAGRELPNEYNPPRLAARLYQEMGKYDEAVVECDRALAKAYGVPKLSLYLTKGRLLELKKDREAARKAYDEGIGFGRTLPEGVGRPVVTALEKASAAVGKTP